MYRECTNMFASIDMEKAITSVQCQRSSSDSGSNVGCISMKIQHRQNQKKCHQQPVAGIPTYSSQMLANAFVHVNIAQWHQLTPKTITTKTSKVAVATDTTSRCGNATERQMAVVITTNRNKCS